MIRYHAMIKIAELGSISKAAAALGYSQPGLGNVLNSFEDELGFKLFIRDKTGITLTEAGEDVLEYCKQILVYERKIGEIASSMDHMESGVIKIGAFASALVSFIPRAIKRFSKTFPNVQVYIEEYQAENMFDDLKTGRLDIAVIASNASGGKSIEAPYGYSSHHLLNDQICVLLNKDDPLAESKKIHFSQLAEHNLMIPSPQWDDVLQVDLSSQASDINFRQCVRSDLALFSMVSNNVGVALVSNLEKPIKFDNVVIRELYEDTSRSIDIVVSDFNKSTKAINEFITICQSIVSSSSF